MFFRYLFASVVYEDYKMLPKSNDIEITVSTFNINVHTKKCIFVHEINVRIIWGRSSIKCSNNDNFQDPPTGLSEPEQSFKAIFPVAG